MNNQFLSKKKLFEGKSFSSTEPAGQFADVLLLPPNPQRQGEGGMRLQNIFKKSLPDKTLITIITVSLNCAGSLDKTLENVIRQTYDNKEIIVIDGGSTDGTLEVLRKHEENIDYWVSEPDQGMYQAMNKGIVLATGEWLSFMNAGDLFYGRKILRDLQDDLMVAGDQEIVYGNAALKTSDEYLVQSKVTPVQKQSRRKLFRFFHQAMLVRRKAFLRHGLYDERFAIAGDTNWLNRAYRESHGECFFYVDKIFCIFDFTKGLSHGLKNFFKMRKEDKQTLEQVMGNKLLPKLIFSIETAGYLVQRATVFVFRKTLLYRLFRRLKYRTRYIREPAL